MTTLDQLQDQLNAIQAQLDGMKAAGQREWPQPGDGCWYIALTGEPCFALFEKMYVPYDIFRTKAEATRERDRRALIAELRRHPKACNHASDQSNVWCLVFDSLSSRWGWWQGNVHDTCPASGYFSEKVPGLIEQLGSHLNLLRGA